MAKTIKAKLCRKKLERIESKQKKIKTLHNRFRAQDDHEKKLELFNKINAQTNQIDRIKKSYVQYSAQ